MFRFGSALLKFWVVKKSNQSEKKKKKIGIKKSFEPSEEYVVN